MATGTYYDKRREMGDAPNWPIIIISIILISLMVLIGRSGYHSTNANQPVQSTMSTKCMGGVEYWFDSSVPVLAPKYNRDGTVAACGG